MILADQMEEGTLHKDCLELAGLHSQAVDFSKNGRAVDLKRLPRVEPYRPDFLAPGPEVHIVDRSVIQLDQHIFEPPPEEEDEGFASPKYQYYESRKILGKLYRAINEQEIWKEQIRGSEANRELFWKPFLEIVTKRYNAIVPDRMKWKDSMITARQFRDMYEENVCDSMSQYSEHPTKPISEIEVFMGYVLNGSGVQTSRQRDSSIKLKDSFDRMAQTITKSMRSVRHSESVPLTGYQTKHDNLHLCLACVHAGMESGPGRGWGFENLQSFRVVAACALLTELSVFGSGGGGGFLGVRG